MMITLDVELNTDKVEAIRQAYYPRQVETDFIPITKSDTWYNVRIKCLEYSIIAISSHPGWDWSGYTGCRNCCSINVYRHNGIKYCKDCSS